MNVVLAQRLLAKIKQFPKAFQMGQWFRPTFMTVDVPCGATGCLAGHIVLMEDGFEKAKELETQQLEYFTALPSRLDGTNNFRDILDGPLPRRARELLDITIGQARTLFFWSEWPQPFKDRWAIFGGDVGSQHHEETNLCMVGIMADRVEAFIQENSTKEECNAV